MKHWGIGGLTLGCALACGAPQQAATPGDDSATGGEGSKSAGSGGSQLPGSGGTGVGGGPGPSGGAVATGGRPSGNGGSGVASGGVSAGGSSSGGAAGSGAASSGGGGTASGGSGTGGADPTPTDGCQAPTHPATGQKTITVEGAQRSYYLEASKTNAPVPLLIGFHGAGGTGQSQSLAFGWQTLSGGNAVLMFPDGVGQDWYYGGIGWDNRNNTSPDVKLVQALIDEAKASHCIDSKQIYVAGFSWGGWMATQTACALAGQVRAFASVAGGGPEAPQSCTGPASAIIMHATNDPAEPVASGRTSRDRYQSLNGCDSGTSTVASGNCVAYGSCDKPLWWCEHGGSHEVPAWAPQVIWDFFKAAP